MSFEGKNVSSGAAENPLLGIFRKTYKFLSSVKLALALLVIILACCLVGVTLFRGQRAGAVIFGTIWFNALLVLLVINVACCFFPRMWGRKLTLISFGMILFHLSFVAILAGIIYNSQYYFRGLIRLTEGETLPSGVPGSYDYEEHGRFFDFAKLKGETTLIKMHRGYKVGGVDKEVAYEVVVGPGALKKKGIIYITHKLEQNGFGYFRDREGYSVLVVLEDKAGKALYGAFVPLQSFKQKDGSFVYVTGTKEGPEPFPFPQDPSKPVMLLETAFRPSPLKNRDRDGEAVFKVWKLDDSSHDQKTVAVGSAPIGEKVKAGDYYLLIKEVRYWVAMTVNYDPGKPIVLASLWAGLVGMIITFIGRLKRSA